MRYLSRLFQPVITIPKNAKIKNTEITCKSQKLLLECGLIRPTSNGLFTILPLARRALDKLEAQVRSCIESVGGQKVSLPCLTPAALWERTGRLGEVGDELMQIRDRHGKQYLLAPTHEEAVADLLADVAPLSYKQLPLLLYQIGNKYRDEQRPKHGVLRAREFSMLDAYGAHSSAECAHAGYRAVTSAYVELFRRLELPVYQVSAPSNHMGGSVSHEWQLLAGAGEDAVSVCGGCGGAVLAAGDAGACGRCGGHARTSSSIEVGHTFILGTKYSEPLTAHFAPAAGTTQPIIMSCYGIGITRLLAASLEALSSDKSLRWPTLVAPYTAIVIGPKEGSHEWASHGWDRVSEVGERVAHAVGDQDDVIIDDRHHMTIGKRLMMADRTGYPYIVVCGKSTLETPPRYELYRSTAETDVTVQLLTMDELVHVLGGTERAGLRKEIKV